MCPIEVLYAKETAGPKYMALARAIRGAVDTAALAPGDRLPPVRGLANRIGVTPGTVARTYSLLCDEGVLQATVGRGTFVAGDDTPAALSLRLAPHSFDFTAPGLPDMGQIALIRSALGRALDGGSGAVLRNPREHGDEAARTAMLDWIEADRLGRATVDDLVLTHGPESAVQTVMQSVLSGTRPVVLVDEMSASLFARVAGLLRAEVVAVPMDREGIVPTALDDIAAGTRARLLCTAAEAHDPTTLSTPLARREAIAAVARRHDLHVLDYDCTRIGAAQAPAYRALLPERGWHVGGLSSMLSPWLESAFVVAPAGQGAAMRTFAHGAGTRLCAPVTGMLPTLLGNPDTRSACNRVRTEMNRYLRAAADALAAHGPVWREDVPFLWLPLPRGWAVDGFVAAAADAGVSVSPAAAFALPGAHAPRAVRIAVDAQVAFDCFGHAMAVFAALLDRGPQASGAGMAAEEPPSA